MIFLANLFDIYQRATLKDLASRVQACTESHITYVQDLLSLCRKVRPGMAEGDEVAHVVIAWQMMPLTSLSLKIPRLGFYKAFRRKPTSR